MANRDVAVDMIALISNRQAKHRNHDRTSADAQQPGQHTDEKANECRYDELQR